MLCSSHWKDFHMPPERFYIRAQELSLCLCVFDTHYFPSVTGMMLSYRYSPSLRFCEQLCTHQLPLWLISLWTAFHWIHLQICNMFFYFSSNYIPSDYKCTNTDVSEWLVRDSVKSFPSGHASMSAYTAIFMMVSLRILLNVLIMPASCVLWYL